MSLALCALLQTAKSQNVGHAQHVSFFICLFLQAFAKPCVFHCVWVSFHGSCNKPESVSCCLCCCTLGRHRGSALFKRSNFDLLLLYIEWIPSCMNRWFGGLWSDCTFSCVFPSRVLNQSGYTLERISARSWLLCWPSTLPHKVRVCLFLWAPCWGRFAAPQSYINSSFWLVSL